MKFKEYIFENIENDISELHDSFGGPQGRGKALTFNNIELIKRISNHIPLKKKPAKLYRGISLDKFWRDIQLDKLTESDIVKMAGGVRSWAKNKSDAMFYTWNHLVGPFRVLFIWERPSNILLDGQAVNDYAKANKWLEPLDDNEYIADASHTSISTKVVDEHHGKNILIVTLKG